jgi:uric acid transporter
MLILLGILPKIGFGSSIGSTVIVVFVLNIVFNHWTWRRQGTESAVEVAVREGAVAVDVPDDGAMVPSAT